MNWYKAISIMAQMEAEREGYHHLFGGGYSEIDIPRHPPEVPAANPAEGNPGPGVHTERDTDD